MGIRYLNKFLRNECKNSITINKLSDLSGKKIAVDISIYLYRFASEGTLLENIYLMLSLFRHYNITPIFVFDGKPPAEKKELLVKRREDKITAENEYKQLQEQLKTEGNNMDEDDKQELISSMDMLKKQFVYISKSKIETVKELIRLYGATYYDAPGEADELCALLVLKKKVCACLSEDMDLFVYGCPVVLRYLSLMNHTVVTYNMKGILEELGLTQKEFREICVLSGTDYNLYTNLKETKVPTLDKTLKHFKKYLKYKKELGEQLENTFGLTIDTSGNIKKNKNIKQKVLIKETNINEFACDFYEWLNENSDYIENYDMLNKINSIFDLSHYKHDKLKIFERIKILNGPIMYEQIKPILEEDGFVFAF